MLVLTSIQDRRDSKDPFTYLVVMSGNFPWASAPSCCCLGYPVPAFLWTVALGSVDFLPELRSNAVRRLVGASSRLDMLFEHTTVINKNEQKNNTEVFQNNHRDASAGRKRIALSIKRQASRLNMGKK